jgi:linoleoyl-CoA desaturase
MPVTAPVDVAHNQDCVNAENPFSQLGSAQLDQLGTELDAIRDEVFADLGARDARYIRTLIRRERQLAVAARLLLMGSRRKSLWLAGTVALSLAKIVENMEIGHNVMHGQWDWMNDPDINSRSWDWDSASPAASWRHAHNYIHHTYSNIRGKDRDLGYTLLRIDPQQTWRPVFLFQPLYNLPLMAFFEWGVAAYDLNTPAMLAGEKERSQYRRELKGIGAKARGQITKDYLAFPALSGRRSFRSTLTANFTANVMRNVWAYSIIVCGHFPDQTYTFSEAETVDESRGQWYLRQLLGAANIEGSRAFHLLAGNLSYQVEHHLFPDMPSNRYREVAPRVREVLSRYGLPYNTGPFHRQLGMVHRSILRLAFPGGRPRPKATPSAAGR